MSPVQSAQCAFADAEAPRPSWRDTILAVFDSLIHILRNPLSNAGPVPAADAPPRADVPSPNPNGERSTAPRIRLLEAPTPTLLAEDAVAGGSAPIPWTRPVAGLHPKSSTIDGKPIPKPSLSPPSRQSSGRPQPQSPRKAIPTGRRKRLRRTAPQPQSQRWQRGPLPAAA